MKIFGVFYNYFKDKKCKPYVAPYDIFLENSKTKDVVQPDLFVMCDPESIRDGRYYGVPSLIIEIISPSSRRNDLIKKLNLYMTVRVEEYLIVDPIYNKLHYWRFKQFEIEQVDILGPGEVYCSSIFEGMELNLADIFEVK